MHRKILFVVFVCAALVHAEPSAYDLELVRQDSRFVEFEKFFDIEKIQKENILFCTSDRRGREEEFKRQSFLGGSVSKVCTVTGYKYKIYANPKAKMPFRKLFVEFVLKKESKMLKENPLRAVNLVNEIYKAVRKNPSFEKWLENKNLRLKNNEVTSVEFNRDENVWKKVGMFGEYMGTLKIHRLKGHPLRLLLTSLHRLKKQFRSPLRKLRFQGLALLIFLHCLNQR